MHLHVTSLFVALMLAVALLSCEAASPEQGPGEIATPTVSSRMSGVVPETGTDTLPKQDKSKYPNLDVYLNKLVARFEKRREHEKPAVGEDSIYDAPVLVKVYSSGDVNTITTWLENNGIKDKGCSLAPLSFCVSGRAGGGTYAMTVIPVDLLVSLSQHPNVSFVSATEPYPKLSEYFRHLAVEFDEGQRYYTARPTASLRQLNSAGTIWVPSNPDTLEAIIAWLEDKGIDRHTVKEDEYGHPIPERMDITPAFVYLDVGCGVLFRYRVREYGIHVAEYLGASSDGLESLTKRVD